MEENTAHSKCSLHWTNSCSKGTTQFCKPFITAWHQILWWLSLTHKLHDCTHTSDIISHMFYWKGKKTITLTMTTGTSSLPSTSAMCSNLLPRYHGQNTSNNYFKISTTISLANIFSIHTPSHIKLMESINKQMVCCLSYVLEPSNKQHAACQPLLLPTI
jgi:hypothetical protein